MLLPINEAIIKYKDYIDAINKAKQLLEKDGFRISASEDFELGAEWTIYFNDTEVAEFMWNVLYMLSFTPKTQQTQEAFYVDYIKNSKDWQTFLTDAVESIIATKN